MINCAEKVEELHKSWKEVSEIKAVRDITTEFAVRSKARDLSVACKVCRHTAHHVSFIKYIWHQDLPRTLHSPWSCYCVCGMIVWCVQRVN